VYFDSCGAVTQTDFCEFGCVDSVGCCVEGTHAEEDECIVDPVEPMPDQSEDSVTTDSSEFTAEVEPAPDAGVEIIGPDVGPEGNGDSNGGCSATREGGQSGLALVLMAVAMLLWLRTGRRRLS
jgi:MYXO-CTERM domain-containing protein